MSFHNFLNKHRYQKDSNQIKTNTRIPQQGVSSGGVWSIPDDEYTQFLDLYNEEVLSLKQPEYLTEKQLEKGGPLLIDLDFRYKMIDAKRHHDEATIDAIIEEIILSLNTIFDVNDDYCIWVQQKPNIYKDTIASVIKDGLHFTVGVQMNKQERIYFRKLFIDYLQKDKIFENMPLTNTLENIVDDAVINGSSNWQLFGSCKPGREAYKLLNTFKVEGGFEYEEVDEQEWKFNIHQLSARYKKHPKFELLQEMAIPESKPKVYTVFDTRPSDDIVLQKFNSYLLKGCLTKSSLNRESWLKVGFALYNEFHDALGYNLFVEFTNLCPEEHRYDEHKVYTTWNSIVMSDTDKEILTFKTIQYYAQKNEPTMFQIIESQFKDNVDLIDLSDNTKTDLSVDSDDEADDEDDDEDNHEIINIEQNHQQQIQKLEKKKEVKLNSVNKKAEKKREKEEKTQKAEELMKICDDNFVTMCEEFEMNHVKIINKSFFIKTTDDDHIIFDKSALITSYEHCICKQFDPVHNSTKNRSFITEWLRYPKIKKFDDVGIYPNPLLCPKNIYNLWTPFEMEKYGNTEYIKHEEGLKTFLKHIKILCGNNDDVTKYITDWIAFMIQYPEIKSITPVLLSSQGAGKNTLIQFLQAMLGSKKVIESTKPERDVWGNFNSMMKSAFLVNLDELGKKQCNDSIGEIKGLQTAPKISINQKGVDSYFVDSYHHFIITSNDLEGGAIRTCADDRRNLIIKSSDELIGNKKYFNHIYSLMQDITVLRTIYDHLKTLPVKDFNSKPTPKTEFQQNLARLTKCPIELWLESYCLEHIHCKEIEQPTKDYYAEFNSWKFKTGHDTYNLTDVQFGVRLSNKNIPGIGKSIATTKGNRRTLNMVKLRNHFFIGDIQT